MDDDDDDDDDDEVCRTTARNFIDEALDLLGKALGWAQDIVEPAQEDQRMVERLQACRLELRRVMEERATPLNGGVQVRPKSAK
jgi:hypothetical protein